MGDNFIRILRRGSLDRFAVSAPRNDWHA